MNEKKMPQPVRTLIIVENLPVPFDRRVWSEATALRDAGYHVAVICPKARGYDRSEETIDGIHVFRHPLPGEPHGAVGYVLEYSIALFWEFTLSVRILFKHGFDVIHACNPPDLIFLIGMFYKITAAKKFIFDHHDANPELYEAKFGRRDIFWRVLRLAERLTFWAADVSIATNESYREIAIERGGMHPDNVFVVRSGPDLNRVKEREPDIKWRNGRRFMVGYVGVIAESEGLDLLLLAIDHIVNVRRRSDVQFVVIGAGPELQNVVGMCERMALGDYVTFTGQVDDTLLFTILSTSDVCVNPDRVTVMNDISTMNKILEYMAVGKPIVQFDVKEGRVSAQDASLYARANDATDFGDKVLELIDDPQRRALMARRGRERVRNELSWQHERPKLLEAYDALFRPRAERQRRVTS